MGTAGHINGHGRPPASGLGGPGLQHCRVCFFSYVRFAQEKDAEIAGVDARNLMLDGRKLFVKRADGGKKNRKCVQASRPQTRSC